ncbi:MAG TPA: T9SS type A sorting domain-containing protein [Flavobacteriales bacterium]|nr:T9SS type A sorting domain-containing protein [Flavobacteriales bacterium]
MIRSALSLVALPVVALASAQNYNWGWGPPISVNQNGSTITCAVLDPLTDLIRTTSLTSVASWTHADGVVATVSATGTVRAVVYDIDLAAFRETQLSSSSGNTYINSDGVVAWVSGAGTVGAAVYDPWLQQWRQDQLSSNSGNQIQNRDGVVTYVSSAGTLGAAVYDPGLGQWRNTQLSSNSGNAVQNRDGIVGWVSSAGTLGAAIYDPSLGQWRSDQLSSNSGNALVLGQGVVAWKSAAGTLGAAAYNWNTDSWTSEQLSSSASNTMPTITNGTVQWTNSNGQQRYGFNSSGQWQNNVNTAVRCEYHAEVVGSGIPRIAYLWCLSIGASTYAHACGDGHTVTRRWGWKRYANAGLYQPQLTVFSATTNSTCDATLNFVGTALPEGTNNTFQVNWNGAQLRISAAEALGVVEVFDANGRCLSATTSADRILELPFVQPPGIYLVRSTGRLTQRVVIH